MLLLSNIFHLFHIFIDYRRRSETVRSMPIRMWVETASLCNLRCVMCLNKDLCASEKGLMDFSLFRKIIDEAKHFVNDMYLHHRGEPLLNPALFDMITYAREAGVKTRFHTNGTLLNEEKARKLLEAGPDLVSFSVDGFDKHSYEQIRVGANFEETVSNIIRLVEIRKSMNLKKPYVVVEKIRFRNPSDREDKRKTDELRDKFLDAGVNEVIEKDEYIWAEENAPETGKVPPEYSACTFPWYAMAVCADGTVTPCPQDYRAKMAMGNVNDNTLKEIWNGEAYRDLRRKFKTDLNSLVLCRKCDRLQRKTVCGVPLQYMTTFFVDQLVGYNKRLRKLFGTSERN